MRQNFLNIKCCLKRINSLIVRINGRLVYYLPHNHFCTNQEHHHSHWHHLLHLICPTDTKESLTSFFTNDVNMDHFKFWNFFRSGVKRCSYCSQFKIRNSKKFDVVFRVVTQLYFQQYHVLITFPCFPFLTFWTKKKFIYSDILKAPDSRFWRLYSVFAYHRQRVRAFK